MTLIFIKVPVLPPQNQTTHHNTDGAIICACTSSHCTPTVDPNLMLGRPERDPECSRHPMGPPSAVELDPQTLNVKFILIYFNVDYFYSIILCTCILL